MKHEHHLDVLLTKQQKMIVSALDQQLDSSASEQHSQYFGVRRLYWGPTWLIILPRMIKLAATSGVGAMIVPTSLQKKHLSGHAVDFWVYTHCISYGVKRPGFWLDQNLALHPSISNKPAKVAVGSIHHSLNLSAWPKWRTENV